MEKINLEDLSITSKDLTEGASLPEYPNQDSLKCNGKGVYWNETLEWIEIR
jgi:hypothetical protein